MSKRSSMAKGLRNLHGGPVSGRRTLDDAHGIGLGDLNFPRSEELLDITASDIAKGVGRGNWVL